MANILVVDDEPHICEVISQALGGCGWKFHLAYHPDQAKQLLHCTSFQVVIADVDMPGVSGFDLMALTRTLLPHSKFILMTGVSRTGWLADALSLGAFDYFEKPFNINELKESVRRALSQDVQRQYLTIKAARAMELSKSFRDISLGTIGALVHAVEAKDPYTRRHSEQVAHYAVQLAPLAGLSGEAVQEVRAASLLHDIGKIGTPDNILTKPGPLDERELQHIRRHPILGFEILASVPTLAHEARLVRHHHENWDGSGYPDGLSGEQIPLGARIINVADSIDAMLMRRTYKVPYTLEHTIREIRRGAGRQFDPAIAAAAVEWCSRNPDLIIRPGNCLEQVQQLQSAG